MVKMARLRRRKEESQQPLRQHQLNKLPSQLPRPLRTLPSLPPPVALVT